MILLKPKIFHILLENKRIEIIKACVYYYFKVNKNYLNYVLFYKYKGSCLMNRLIMRYPLSFTSILCLTTSRMEIHQNDFFIMLFLLIILKVNHIFIYMSQEVENKIHEIFSRLSNLFIIGIIEGKYNAFEHMIVVYNEGGNLKTYNIMNPGEKIYLINTSCVINCFCFIIDKLGYAFSTNDIYNEFYLLRNLINIKSISQMYENEIQPLMFKILRNNINKYFQR